MRIHYEARQFFIIVRWLMRKLRMTRRRDVGADARGYVEKRDLFLAPCT